jgi:magnesium chelatase family protein
LRPVRGALAQALALPRSGHARCLVLPRASAAEASLAGMATVRQAGHLLEVVQAMRPGEGVIDLPQAVPPTMTLPAGGLDLAEVRGQAGPKRALEIAAAGGSRGARSAMSISLPMPSSRCCT